MVSVSSPTRGSSAQTPRARRALVIVENLSVPTDRRVWQECLALTEAGWEMTVICPSGTTRDTEPFERISDIDIYRYPLTAATNGPIGYVREYATALARTRRLAFELARAKGFDVVQACNPPDILLAGVRRLKTTYGASFVFDHHDLVPELYESRFGRGRDFIYGLTLRAEQRAYALADVVIATNESYRAVALTRGAKSPEDVFVVRNAPDVTRFRRVEPDDALKRGREHLIAYLGLMGPQDGIDHALRALASISSRLDWHAVFVGDGDVLPAMRQLAQRLELGDRVEFTGLRGDADIQRILSTAAVGLSPDPKSPLNDVSTMNKILEYMAMAVPIVTYDLVEAHVSAGDAALYATANDEASFGREISRLLDDESLRRRLGATGRQRIESSALSWDTSKRELTRAYERAFALRSTARQPLLQT